MSCIKYFPDFSCSWDPHLSPFSPFPNHRSWLSLFNPNSGTFKSLVCISPLREDNPMKIQINIVMGSLNLTPSFMCPPEEQWRVSLPYCSKVLSCLSTSEGGLLGGIKQDLNKEISICQVPTVSRTVSRSHGQGLLT